MKAFKFNLKNMCLEEHKIPLEKTDRGAIMYFKDDGDKVYLPKDKVNRYEPFGLKGAWVMVFEGEYNPDLALNGFLNAIIESKERQKESETVDYEARLLEIDRKIEYFRSNLKPTKVLVLDDVPDEMKGELIHLSAMVAVECEHKLLKISYEIVAEYCSKIINNEVAYEKFKENYNNKVELTKEIAVEFKKLLSRVV